VTGEQNSNINCLQKSLVFALDLHTFIVL